MTSETRWCHGVFAATCVGLLTMVGTAAAGPPLNQNDKIPRTPEEVVPGVPLDGSIIIDEGVWLSLIGEPGRHMTDGYEYFTKGNLPDSAESIRKAASFLYIASENALEGPNVGVQKAADALARLHRRVAAGEVKSANELRSVFSRAHLAMSRHHVAKAADAFAKSNWELVGNYLHSSANHLERASYWAGRDLRPDTEQTVTHAKREAGRLVEEGGKSVEKAGRLIETLGKRIERFGKSLTGNKPANPDSKDNSQ